ncbi:MAG: SMC-Scp complex subunit ScpB [Acidimicrobiales bacterium]|nr:SMC-Scp complex subunit ScpB [Acidimicrobiales bacterium]MDP6760248.1 SMC-Scp complex subunit ScpB [Acidimicrobiales bacterium]
MVDDAVNGEGDDIRRAIEAILMVSIDPVAPNLLAQLMEVPTKKVEAICSSLADGYEAEGRGFALVRVGGGYRFQSHPTQAAWVERFVLEGQHSRLTSAALETLAIVAYKQPISRNQVSAIRGVDVDTVIRTLQQRGYIEVVATDPGPGNALMFGTTREFLESMGIDRVSDLPALGDFVPGPEIVEALERGLLADPDVAELEAEAEAGGEAEGGSDAEVAVDDRS